MQEGKKIGGGSGETMEADSAAIDIPFLVSGRKRVGFSTLTRRKHSNAQQHRKGSPQLVKHLKIWELLAVGIGATIGAGVYVLVGTVARDKAGPSLSASFLIAGVAAALSAFCYAELASRCPSAGSAYHYAYLCVGEGIAWIIGWALILEYTVGGAAVARGISPNLAIFFGGSANLPGWLSRRLIPGTSIVCDPCALLLVAAVTCLLSTGIRESAFVQTVMTAVNCSVLLFVIVVGSWLGFRNGWPGYNLAGGYMPFGVSGLLSGAATVFFAFIGFDAVASTAEEVKHPQRDLPIGIGLSLFICGSIYIVVSAVMVGIVPYYEMDLDTPMSTAFMKNGLHWAMYAVAAGAVAALSTALLGALLPQPRILMAMSRDGLLPPLFSKVNKATSVPVYSTVVTGFAAGCMAFLLNVDELSGMVSVGTLMAFSIVAVSILILRYVPPIEPLVLSAAPTQEVPFVKKKSGIPVHLKKEEHASPILSIFSESSIPEVDDDATSLSSSSSSNDLTMEDDSALQSGMPSSSRLGLDDEKEKEERRRRYAACGISGVCIGVVLLSIATSAALLPSWLCWIMGVIGTSMLLVGSAILLLIDQDEGRHQFGQSGGFHCPGVPVLPIMCIMVNVYLLANLGSATWLRVSAWLVIGVFVYSFYGIHHSSLSKDLHTIM
ncbi:cationic amino acid transporter 2, vacuolar [Selaginella moellendorffii]|nr:cationic amino acid transporter 2, vacuolar [Selaginella moellendorffii]|eukprot:XP_024516097.1 cationic amino acid transporter 2, vacuolar [Selaginella moellendorffii]